MKRHLERFLPSHLLVDHQDMQLQLLHESEQFYPPIFLYRLQSYFELVTTNERDEIRI